MSTEEAHGANAHGTATANADAHAFDDEPVHALSPDEPRTPNWVPALGAALFVAVGVWFLVTAKGDDATAGAAASASASAYVTASAPANAAPAPPATNAARAAQPRQAVAPPSGAPARPAPSGSARRYTKEDLERMRKSIQGSHKP